MGNAHSFNDVLEAVEGLSFDKQETLVGILRRRLAERRRAELVQDAREAYEEYQRGECRPTTPQELVREIREYLD